jgi:hypothetical protein
MVEMVNVNVKEELAAVKIMQLREKIEVVKR